MLNILKKLNKYPSTIVAKNFSTVKDSGQRQMSLETEDFKPLNLKSVKSRLPPRSSARKTVPVIPRTTQMPIDQDWGNVWPGPRSFHPGTVPLPVRQGYIEKGMTVPSKYGNAELMKIPNFLHLTPPVIKRQCEAIKKFCTKWPEALDSDEKCEQHFPLEVAFSNYCHSSPSIRDPNSRIVTVRVKLSSLKLDKHARDKFLRLVGERYDEKSDIVTIVTDRCPTRNQNYEYALYLITALYHESWNVEEWEKLKSEADIEHYNWSSSKSKNSVEALFGKKVENIANVDDYSKAVDDLMNDGENEQNIANYGWSVRKMLEIPDKLSI